MPSTVNWIAGSGDFNNPANWTDAADGSHHVPGSGDDAVINVGTNFTVTVQESHTLKSLHANCLLDVSNNAVLTLNNFFNDSNVNQLVLEGGTALRTAAGTTALYGGGYLSGDLDVSGGATLAFTGGAQALNSGVTLSGPGQFSVAGAALALNTDLTAPTNFELDSGSLGGPQTWTVSGATMKWTGGTMSGTGTTLLTNSSSLILSGTNAKDLDTRSLVTAPGCTVTWKDSGSFRTFNGPVITNNGTWDLQNNASLFNQGGIPASFTNTGTFQKSAGIGTSSIGNIFNNQGGSIVVSVAGGTLDLPGGTSNGGSYMAVPGAAIDLTSGQMQNITGTLTGTGGGAVYLDNNGSLNVLPGGATLAFDPGVFQWFSGTIQGAATITNAGALTLLGTGAKDFASGNGPLTFDNEGTLTWRDSGSIRTFNGPALNNDGTWDAQGNASLFNQGGVAATFTNTGTLSKLGGVGTTSIGNIFDNQGGSIVVSVAGGALNLPGGTSTGGTYTVAPNAAIDLTSGQTQNISGTFTGTGGGAVYLDNSGSLNILPGGATLAFDPGMFQWYSGTIYGLDTLTNAGDLTLLGTGAKDFANPTLSFVNAGTLTWEDSGSIRTFNEPALENDGTWTMQSDASLFNQSGVNAVFKNTGTLQKSAGAGTSSIGSIFDNTGGILSVASGTVVLSGGGTSFGGIFNVATPLGLDFSSGTYVLTTGTSFTDVGLAYVNGATVSVQDVVSAGDFQVYNGTLELTTTGILNLSGTYTQSGGSLVIDFEGPAAGSGYGQLNVSGKASLGGNLFLTMLNGYRPDVGTVFSIINYGSYEGVFNAIFGTDLGGGIKLDPVYSSTALTLTTVSTTAPDSSQGGRTLGSGETLPATPAATLPPADATDSLVSADQLLEAASPD